MISVSGGETMLLHNHKHFTCRQATPDSEGTLALETRTQGRTSEESGCGALSPYFDNLESSLGDAKDFVQSQAILVDITQLLETQKSRIMEESYTCMLNRLTQIYTRGLEQPHSLLFANTAVSYAGLVKTVSQTHLAYDYSETIGQLLLYMNHLYKHGKKGWLRIFEHLINMPDSIQGIQVLKERHLKGIQDWIEEGVDNLYELREDQIHLHSEQIAKLAGIEDRVDQISQELARQKETRIFLINRFERKIELDELIKQRDHLIDQLEDRQRLVELLEQNMHQFEDKLHATRRAYLIRAL